MGRWLLKTLVFLLVAAGAVWVLRPLASDQYNRRLDARLVAQYARSADDMDPEAEADLLEQCRTYNLWHRSYGIADPFTRPLTDANADELLDRLEAVDDSGALCVLEIPKLGVALPVYRGVNAETLDKGAAFAEGSSLPVGGQKAHTVLAARSGKGDGRRFGRLNRLKEGDLFDIRVMNEVIHYRVDRVEECSPQRMGDINQPGDDDCCTLVARVDNGARLLVRGRITEDRLTAENDAAARVPEVALNAVLALPALAAGGLLLLLIEGIVRARGRYRLNRIKKRMNRIRRK